MGWTSYHRPPGETDREHLERELLRPPRKILDCATIDGVFYAAVAEDEGVPDEAPNAQVWALIVDQHRGRGEFNYSYKAMDETEGPYASACPERILDLLTPTDSDYAKEWRERCRENARRQAAKPKLKKGDRIKLERKLTFGDGVSADTFTLKDGRRNHWRRSDGLLVRLPARRRLPAYEKV